MANALTRFANYAAPKTGSGIISALRVSRTNIAFGPGNEGSANTFNATLGGVRGNLGDARRNFALAGQGRSASLAGSAIRSDVIQGFADVVSINTDRNNPGEPVPEAFGIINYQPTLCPGSYTVFQHSIAKTFGYFRVADINIYALGSDDNAIVRHRFGRTNFIVPGNVSNPVYDVRQYASGAVVDQVVLPDIVNGVSQTPIIPERVYNIQELSDINIPASYYLDYAYNSVQGITDNTFIGISNDLRSATPTALPTNIGQERRTLPVWTEPVLISPPNENVTKFVMNISLPQGHISNKQGTLISDTVYEQAPGYKYFLRLTDINTGQVYIPFHDNAASYETDPSDSSIHALVPYRINTAVPLSLPLSLTAAYGFQDPVNDLGNTVTRSQIPISVISFTFDGTRDPNDPTIGIPNPLNGAPPPGQYRMEFTRGSLTNFVRSTSVTPMSSPTAINQFDDGAVIIHSAYSIRDPSVITLPRNSVVVAQNRNAASQFNVSDSYNAVIRRDIDVIRLVNGVPTVMTRAEALIDNTDEDVYIAEVQNPAFIFMRIVKSSLTRSLANDIASRVDLMELYNASLVFAAEGTTFSYVFRELLNVSNALKVLCDSCRSSSYFNVYENRYHLVLDRANGIIEATFLETDIIEGTASKVLSYDNSDINSRYFFTFLESDSWALRTITLGYNDPVRTAETSHLPGVTTMQQAQNLGWATLNSIRFRRTAIKFSTSVQVLLINVGSRINVSHPLFGTSAITCKVLSIIYNGDSEWSVECFVDDQRAYMLTNPD